MLTRLEIQGFKSFADRTGLDFDVGITAIVGPNGAGKSNIADAVRWSLGEQRARELRGQRMDDLIFNGSRSRRMMGLARTRVTLANEDGRYPLPYAALTLGREVNRDGRGRYLINGQQVRLRDVEELLYGTGLGPAGYALIGQGEVDRVMESDADELRALIEEAAGTSAERAWLHRSHSPREQVRGALERLRDREALIGARLEPLVAEVRRLRLHRRATAVLAGLRRALQRRELARVHHRQDAARQAARRHARQVAGLLAASRRLRARHGRIHARSQALEDQLESRRAALAEARQAAQAAARRVVRARDEQEDLSGARRQLTHERQALEAERRELQSLSDTAVQELETRLEGLEETVQRLAPRAALWEAAVETVDGRLRHWRDEAARLHLEARRMEQQLRAAARQEQEHRRRQSERQRARKNLGEALAAVDRQQQGVSQHRGQVTALQAQVRALLAAAEGLRQRLESKRRETAARLEQLRSRIETVENLQRSHAGYYRGVRRVLKGMDAGEEAFQGCIGPLSELLKVPPRYRRAVAAALGSAQQQLVCHSADDAVAAITVLEQEGAGRATFLPLDALQQPRIPDDLPAMEDGAVLGWAPDLIDFDAAIAPAVEHRLGRVLVVAELDQARRLFATSGRRLMVVTLSGALIHPGGAMTGGHQGNKGQDSPLIGRTQDLHRWRRQLAEVEARQALLAVLSDEWEEGQVTVEGVAGDLARQEHRYGEVARRLARSSRQLERRLQENGAAAHAASSQDGEPEIDALRRLGRDFRQLEQAEGQARRRVARYEELGQELRLERDDLREDLTSVRVRRRELGERLEELRRRHRSAGERLDHIEGAMEELQTRARHLERRRQSVSEELAAAQTDHRQAEADVVQLEPAVERAVGRHEAAQRHAQRLKQVMDAMMRRLQRHRRQRDRALADHRRLRIRQEERARPLGGAGDIAQLAAAREDSKIRLRVQGLSFAALRRAIRRLEALRTRLEPVNGRAEAEHEGLMRHYGATCRQLEDLLACEQFMGQLQLQVEERLARRFHETFAVLNRAFARLFARLFQGGHAELVPEATADEHVPGCRIEAQPPGKRRQPLRLLSGGERALTAIALLFAFLAVRPSPFVVLDEVDAALDDPNLERFCRFVQEYSDHIQFILITHQKPTMEVADRLFGVTMADDGVSQVVSVRLRGLRAVSQEVAGVLPEEREEAQ